MSDKQVRAQYTREFKLEAVRQVRAGQAIAAVAKVLGIPTRVRHQIAIFRHFLQHSPMESSTWRCFRELFVVPICILTVVRNLHLMCYSHRHVHQSHQLRRAPLRAAGGVLS